MAITINPRQLLSRRIRLQTTGNDQGLRKISDLFSLTEQSGEEGLLERIWDSTRAFTGWAGRLLNGLRINTVRCLGYLRGAVTAIKQFDWNQTDEELRALLEQRWNALGSIWGGAAGGAAGWLVGIGIGYGLSLACPVIGGAALARSVASSVAEEAIDELTPLIRQAVIQTAGYFAQQGLLNGYIAVRHGLQSLPRDTLSRIVGEEAANWMKDVWGSDSGANISINNLIDNAIESIPSQWWRNFWEEFLDESEEAFWEAGFVIAHEWDAAFVQASTANNVQTGPNRTITLKPDREAGEVIAFQAVPQKELEREVQQTLTTHRLIANRDVGAWVGEPYEERIRAQFMLRKLTIQFSSRESPPWRHEDGQRAKKVICQIPDAKQNLTWTEIKAACDPYNWGPYCARAKLNNNRQMAVYGASETEADRKLEKLLRLTTAEPLKVTTSYEAQVPTRMRKEPTLVYPAYCTLLARTQSIDEQGRVDLTNRIYDEQTHKIPLWPDSEPPNIPQIL